MLRVHALGFAWDDVEEVRVEEADVFENATRGDEVGRACTGCF